jgi:hypothetical protein
MTAIAYVGNADTQQPLFSVATLEAGPGCTEYMPSGIFCIGALTAPDGQFLYLSLIGRDTAFQELRGKMTTGRINSFVIRQDDKQSISGWFSREWLGQMEYHGAKLQTALFGEVGQMILYHPLLTTPDKANQTAALPFMGTGSEQNLEDLWNVVKHVCEVPLLDGWMHFVMALLYRMEWFKLLFGFNCNANYVKLGSNIGGLISANIRSGALCIEADEAGHYAFPEKLTLDPEFGLAECHQLPRQPQGDGDGFWDDAEVMDCYSRAQAIDDGELVDVSDSSEAREAGFRVPVALTRAVWDRFVEWDNDEVAAVQRRLGQSTAGRLWDVLYMARHGINTAPRNQGGTLLYELYAIPRDGHSAHPRRIKLKLHSGGGDNGEHVITIMLPDED